MSLPAAVYLPRNPQLSDYYRCLEDCFETFVRIYDEHFSSQYGFWLPYLEKVIYRYLDCGDLHNGFARVKCKDCGHEYLLDGCFYGYKGMFRVAPPLELKKLEAIFKHKVEKE